MTGPSDRLVKGLSPCVVAGDCGNRKRPGRSATYAAMLRLKSTTRFDQAATPMPPQESPSTRQLCSAPPCQAYQEAARPFEPVLPHDSSCSRSAARPTHAKRAALRTARSAGALAGSTALPDSTMAAARQQRAGMSACQPRTDYATTGAASSLRLPSVHRQKQQQQRSGASEQFVDCSNCNRAPGGGLAPAERAGGNASAPCWSPVPSAESLFGLQQEVAARKTVFVAAQLQVQTCVRLVAGIEDDLRWEAVCGHGQPVMVMWWGGIVVCFGTRQSNGMGSGLNTVLHVHAWSTEAHLHIQVCGMHAPRQVAAGRGAAAH